MGKCDADSGVLFSACLPVSQSLRSDARCCDAGSRVGSPACPCVSQSLRSDARCCDAGSGVACFLSPSLCGQMPDAVTRLPLLSLCLPRLCGQMPDAVTLAVGWCLPLVSACVSQSLRSDARCCDAGSGVVSPACLPVSQSDAVTLAAGSCLPLVFLCLPVSAVRC